MDNAPMLTMMCGLPRSGKSTWIKKNKEDDVIVSPDQIRLKVFGVQFYSEVEQFVWGFTRVTSGEAHDFSRGRKASHLRLKSR